MACAYEADGATQRIVFDGADTLAITLTADDDYRAVIDDLNVGADCWIVAETATGGANDVEFSVSKAQPLTVTETADPQGAQTITVTNTFNTGTVTVNKDIVGDGAQRFGQNEFTVRTQCTYGTDRVVTNVMWSENSFIDIVLNPENSYTHTEANLIEGADCWVESEVRTGSSNVQDLGEHVIVVGDNLGDGDPQEPVSITVTNTFNTASVSIRKNEVGAVAGRFGTQTYTVLLACTYDVNGTATDVLWDGQRTLEVNLGPDNDYTHVEEGLLVGASCAVVDETITDDANDVDLGQPVIVTDQADVAPVVKVTNTFNTAEVTIAKVIEGKGTAQYGAGPFTAQLQCAYDKDGVTAFVTWDGNDTMEFVLSTENDYT